MSIRFLIIIILVLSASPFLKLLFISIIQNEFKILILSSFSQISTLQVVGVSCGQNGSCTFYKGLRVVIPSASASSTSRFGSNRNRHTNNSIKSKDVVSNNNNNSKVNVVNGKLRTSISSQGDGCDNDNNLTSESCENNKCDVTDGDKKQLDANANER